MSNATQIAWAAVRECNEAIKAAECILAQPAQEGWYTIQRGDWVEYKKTLFNVINRSTPVGDLIGRASILHDEVEGLSNPDAYGQVMYNKVKAVHERLLIHHTELTKIWEATQ